MHFCLHFCKVLPNTHRIWSCLSDWQDVGIFYELMKSVFLSTAPLSVHRSPSSAVALHMFLMQGFSRSRLTSKGLGTKPNISFKVRCITKWRIPSAPVCSVSWGMYEAQGSFRVELRRLHHTMRSIRNSVEMQRRTVSVVLTSSKRGYQDVVHMVLIVVQGWGRLQ